MRVTNLVLAAAVALLSHVVLATTPCFHLTDCNGHGTCEATTKTCKCFAGWGAAADIATYKAPDCSQRKQDIPCKLPCWGCSVAGLHGCGVCVWGNAVGRDNS